MRNTIISSIRQGIRNAIESVVSALAPIFYWPGTHTLEATTGTDPTFTRATAATFEDFEGVIRTVESSEPRFQGARRVENLVTVSEGLLTDGNLADAGTTTVLESGVVLPNGQTGSVNRVSTAGSQTNRLYWQTGVTGQTYTYSYWIRSVTGTILNLRMSTGDFLRLLPDVTPTWQKFSFTGTATAGEEYILRGNGDAAAPDVYITEVQIEDVTGQTNQNPSEYVSTGVGTGPELVVNGDFATDSDWTLTNGIITGGQFVGGASGAQGVTQTSTDVVEGKAYQLTFDAYVASSIAIVYLRLGSNGNQGGWTVGVTPTTFTGTFTAAGASGLIFLLAGNGNGLHLDNISIKSTSHGANVDGVQYFNTLNANTVTANVVTEAVGSPLTRANTQFGELMAAGDYFSTPNVVTTWGELDIRVRTQVDSIPNGSTFLADKNTSFFLRLRPLGSSQMISLRLYLAAGGLLDYSSIAFPTSQFGVRNWYRVTYDAATGDVKFFTADGNLEAPAISDYVQLGTTQNSGANDIRVSTNSFLVGSYGAAFNSYPFDGDIYRSQVYNEIDGTTPVVDFDFGDYVSGSTWTGIPYGPDVVINGDFATDTDWGKYAAWTISGGSANCNQTTAGSSFISQGPLVVSGQTYEFTYTVSNYVAGNVNSRLGSINGPAVSANGTYTDIITSDGTTIWLRGTNLFVGSIDNVSVRNIPLFTLQGNASVFQPPVDASGPLGYLAEKASTNLVIQSEDFTTTWTAYQATVAANAAVAPDGTTTMDRFVVAATTNVWHGAYQQMSTTAGTNYTASAYIKDDGAGYASVAFGINVDFIAVVVDLSTGLVTDTEVGANSGTIVATGCEDAGNGIYRVWISGSIASVTGALVATLSDVAVPAAWQGAAPAYTGVLGEDILVWGAQLELGTYPTSYIPTTTTAVTRNGDLLSLANGIVDGSLGTVSLEASSGHNVNGGTSHTLFSFNGSYRMFANTISGTGYYPVVAGVVSATGVSRYNTAVQSAMTYNGLDVTVYHGPVSNSGTLLATPIPVSSNPKIGSYANAHQPDYNFREVKIFDSELTAEEVGDL